MLLCPNRHRVSDDRNWYVPLGKTLDECTYCEECYNKFIKGTVIDIGYTVYGNVNDCNCDYPKDLGKNCFMNNDIKVSVIDAKTYDAYKIKSNKKVIVPKNAKYMICVENMNRTSDSYFIIDECIVDGKIVNLDSDYIKNDIEIGGYCGNYFFIMRSDCRIKLKCQMIKKVNDCRSYSDSYSDNSSYDEVECIRFDIKLIN